MGFTEKLFEDSRPKEIKFFNFRNGKEPRGKKWSTEDGKSTDFVTRKQAEASYRKTVRLKLSEILQDSS